MDGIGPQLELMRTRLAGDHTEVRAQYIEILEALAMLSAQLDKLFLWAKTQGFKG